MHLEGWPSPTHIIYTLRSDASPALSDYRTPPEVSIYCLSRGHPKASSIATTLLPLLAPSFFRHRLSSAIQFLGPSISQHTLSLQFSAQRSLRILDPERMLVPSPSLDNSQRLFTPSRIICYYLCLWIPPRIIPMLGFLASRTTTRASLGP